MHKLYSIFSFVLLYLTVAFGQTDVSIPITVSDNLGSSAPIYFGLDLTATDGIDETLGEAALPGLPPGGYFAAWLFPDLTTMAYQDYRAPGAPPAFPFTGHKSFMIKIQTDIPTGNPMTVSWNLPSTIAATSTIGVTGNLVSFSGTGSHSWNFNPITLAYILVEIDFIDIVPVELTSFNAAVSEGTVVLNWTTATEINNQGFEIERASFSTTPIQDWEKIGYIPGFGTTTEPKSYSFVDAGITTGSYSYRLKQIDYNGTFSYSNEVSVEVNFTPGEYALSQNYPNPFNPSTVIEFSLPENLGNVKLTVYNALGEIVAELANTSLAAGKYSYTWNASNFATGMYIYELRTDKFVSIKKMLLLK